MLTDIINCYQYLWVWKHCHSQQWVYKVSIDFSMCWWVLLMIISHTIASVDDTVNNNFEKWVLFLSHVDECYWQLSVTSLLTLSLLTSEYYITCVDECYWLLSATSLLTSLLLMSEYWLLMFVNECYWQLSISLMLLLLMLSLLLSTKQCKFIKNMCSWVLLTAIISDFTFL